MPRNSESSRSRTALRLLPLAAACALAIPSASAQAQSTDQEFKLERFRIALDREGVLGSEWGTTLGHLRWDIGLWLGAADDPLVVIEGMDGSGGERLGRLVDLRVGGDLVGTIGILSWLQAGLEVPVVLSQNQDNNSPLDPGGSITSVGLGDARIVPKVRLLRSDKHFLDLAILPAFTLPTASSDQYLGEGSATFVPELAISRAFGAVRLAGNLGYRARKQKMLFNLAVDDEIVWRLGAGYRFADAGGPPLEIDLSLGSAAKAENFLDRPNNNHLELLGGVQYTFSQPLLAFAAAGVGLNEGFGTPDWRVLIGARFQLARKKARERIEPPVVVAPPRQCADNDRDCDSVPDPGPEGPFPGQPPETDYCPDVPGTPAHHGCPEPKVVVHECAAIDVSPAITFADGQDVLMPAATLGLDALAAELSGKHASALVSIEVGTSEADKDLSERRAAAIKAYLVGKGVDATHLAGIGIGTAVAAGAAAGTEAGAAIVEPAGSNAVAFRMVCPAKNPPECKNLELAKKIEFEVNKAVIRPPSIEMLEREVVWVLAAHPDVRMTIEGHTSTEGKKAYNMKLSQNRADSVKTYLVSRGIAADRLKTVGYGPTSPLVPEKTEADREKNRRIEFRITAGGNCKPCEKLEVGKIQFEFNSDKIKIASNPELDRVVDKLQNRPDVHLSIEGHTSSEGGAPYNKRLSNLRAAAVLRYLVGHGIARARLTSKGLGEEQLLVNPDNTEEEREVNRRVEFRITRGGDCGETPPAAP